MKLILSKSLFYMALLSIVSFEVLHVVEHLNTSSITTTLSCSHFDRNRESNNSNSRSEHWQESYQSINFSITPTKIIAHNTVSKMEVNSSAKISFIMQRISFGFNKTLLTNNKHKVTTIIIDKTPFKSRNRILII